MPPFTSYTQHRQPSAVRLAQFSYAKRTDHIDAINAAIGNVSLPMHPVFQQRLATITQASGFAQGINQYTPTAGTSACQQAFRHLIHTSTHTEAPLHVCVTDGGSQAMELAVVMTGGDKATHEYPLLLLGPTYPNYMLLAERTGRGVELIERTLDESGMYQLPSREEREQKIQTVQPSALVVIPYDNPTGQVIEQSYMNMLAELCCIYDVWLISDEAYRELMYHTMNAVSIWAIPEQQCPSITGRRISIESASKVWNACGLRIGALVTDNEQLFASVCAEYSSNLGANNIGQYLFAGLAEESSASLHLWYKKQRDYYTDIINTCCAGLHRLLPKLIISSPQGALYSVIDVKHLVPSDFDAHAFVGRCATQGAVNGYTLLLAPLAGFFLHPSPHTRTQFRLAYVETPERLALVPELFAQLLSNYLRQSI